MRTYFWVTIITMVGTYEEDYIEKTRAYEEATGKTQSMEFLLS